MLCAARLRALALASLAMLGGCAFDDREVDLTYEPVVSSASLPGGATVDVTVADFVDARANKATIGKVLNGYGTHTADVVTTDSVPLWMTDALRVELERAGYAVVPATEAGPDALAVTGEVIRVSSDAYVHFKAQIIFRAVVMRGAELLIDRTYTERTTGDLNFINSGQGYNEALQQTLAIAITKFIADLTQEVVASGNPPEISMAD